MHFTHATALLEDIREKLAYVEADRLVEAYTMGEDVPDEVKKTSRDAFAHSGYHGFAMSGMDPHEHQTTAAQKHQVAAEVARKHGLTKLVKVHHKAMQKHVKKAKEIQNSPEQDEDY